MNAEFTIKGDVERLTLGPNDVLAFTADIRTPREFEEFGEVVKHLAERMGLGDRYLLLSRDVALTVVTPKS